MVALRAFVPMESLAEYTKKTDLVLIRAAQDEIVSSKNIHKYKELGTLRYVELSGNHGFTNPKDREKLIAEIQKFVSHRYDSHKSSQLTKIRL